MSADTPEPTSIGTPEVAAILRWLLTLAGAWLAQRGLMEGSDVQAFVGALLPVVSLVWSLLQKWQQRKALHVALAMPAGSTPAQLATILQTKEPA